MPRPKVVKDDTPEEVAAPAKPVRKKRVSKKIAARKIAVEAPETEIEAVDAIIKRKKRTKPEFLEGTKVVRRKGLAKMMTSWTEFAKVGLSFLKEEELEALLKEELLSHRRIGMVQRLHSAMMVMRTKRERAAYEKLCSKGKGK